MRPAAAHTRFGQRPRLRAHAERLWRAPLAEGGCARGRLRARGFPISRALATRLAEAADVVRLDAGLAAEFMDESGHFKSAGSVATRRTGGYVATIRTQGADAFYAGVVGDKIVAYSAAQGGAIGRADLEAYPAARTTPRVLQMGGDYVFLPTSRTGAGAFAGALLDNLARAQATPSGSRDTEAAVIVAVKEALDGFGLNSLPKDLGATGFAATDAKGQAVACAVTMNGPFGSGHTALGTGVALARAPSSGVVGPGFGIPHARDREPQRRPAGDACRCWSGRAQRQCGDFLRAGAHSAWRGDSHAPRPSFHGSGTVRQRERHRLYR